MEVKMKKYGLSLFVILSIFLIGIMGCKSAPTEELVTEEPAVVEAPAIVEPEPEVTKPVVERDWKTENESLIDQVTEARVKALAAGAELYLPDELGVLDVDARETQVVYDDGGDPEVFNTKAKNMLALYQALEQSSLAAERYERIQGFDFAGYDMVDYNKGNEASKNTEDLFTNGASGKEILASATLAADSYDKVLKTAFNKKARDKRAEVLEIKTQADLIKAGVADKDSYMSAVAIFTRGDQQLLEGDPEAAYNSFSTSYEQMASVYKTVSEKRAKAQESIDNAKKRIEASNTKAMQADTVAPIEETDPEQAASQDATTQTSTVMDDAAKDGE
jgi:hypothetical protein